MVPSNKTIVAGWRAEQVAEGAGDHGGAFTTNGWIDPERRIVTVFMVQNVLVPDSAKPREAFQKIVMEAAGVNVPPAAVASKKAKP